MIILHSVRKAVVIILERIGGIVRRRFFPKLSTIQIFSILRFITIICAESVPFLFLVFLRCPGVSKDKIIGVWGSGHGKKARNHRNEGFWVLSPVNRTNLVPHRSRIIPWSLHSQKVAKCSIETFIFYVLQNCQFWKSPKQNKLIIFIQLPLKWPNECHRIA